MKDRIVGLVMLLAMLVGTRFVMAEGTVPPQLQGEWLSGSASLSSYWDSNGSYVGPASGAGQVYIFKPDGTFEYYIAMELRTYQFVSRVHTSYKGTVTFEDGKFTLHLTHGHYNSNASGWLVNRDMTDEEMAKASKSFSYRLEKDSKGKQKMVLPFDDGSSFTFDKQVDTKK